MSRTFGLLLTFIVLIAAPVGGAYAVTPDEVLADPVLEARSREISKLLRCVVCQNQSIDDSNAPLAKDLRVLVRERVTGGDTNEQAIGFIVQRYGNFVLLKPPMQTNTLLLWFGPFLLLGAAAYGLFQTLKRQNQPATASEIAPLSTDDERRLTQLLGDDKAA